MSAVGIVCWLEKEADMDAVTALSGSGPAYFFLLMEAMQEAASVLDWTPEQQSCCVSKQPWEQPGWHSPAMLMSRNYAVA